MLTRLLVSLLVEVRATARLSPWHLHIDPRREAVGVREVDRKMHEVRVIRRRLHPNDHHAAIADLHMVRMVGCLGVITEMLTHNAHMARCHRR